MKFFSILLLVLLFTSSVVYAQLQPQKVPRCLAREIIVEGLTSQLNQFQKFTGYVNEQTVIELFLTEEGSWTLFLTGVDGKSCYVLSGPYHQLKDRPAVEPEPQGDPS